MSEINTLRQLACIPRGEHGELRIELTECSDDRGNASQFVNMRFWFKGDRADMLPGKQGLSIRKTEIFNVGNGLRAALNAMNAGTRPAAPAQAPRPAPRSTLAEPGEDLSCGAALRWPAPYAQALTACGAESAGT